MPECIGSQIWILACSHHDVHNLLCAKYAIDGNLLASNAKGGKLQVHVWTRLYLRRKSCIIVYNNKRPGLNSWQSDRSDNWRYPISSLLDSWGKALVTISPWCDSGKQETMDILCSARVCILWNSNPKRQMGPRHFIHDIWQTKSKQPPSYSSFCNSHFGILLLTYRPSLQETWRNTALDTIRSVIPWSFEVELKERSCLAWNWLASSCNMENNTHWNTS